MVCSGGHDNASTNSLPTGFALDLSRSDPEWAELPEMEQPRRDHACLLVEFEDAAGVLVTGGWRTKTLFSKRGEGRGGKGRGGGGGCCINARPTHSPR